MLFNRESGVLLHITSLPGRYGMGEIGSETLRWLDILRDMGQRIWQILPIGPTGFGDSPYQSFSTFAGNPMLISLASLWRDGLIHRSILTDFPRISERKIDYGRVIPLRKKILYQAAAKFMSSAPGPLRREYEEFAAQHDPWLNDFALFTAIKEAHKEVSWVEWPSALRKREVGALKRASLTYKEVIEAVKVLQFFFDRQWAIVRRAAKELDIRIVGDIPIFVAHDSADVWANPHLYHLDKNGNPSVVAGVPPDYFSPTGQRWGNPIFRWDVHQKQDFAWWAARVKRALDWCDIVRIDHFRGFCAYWEIPGKAPTAVRGKWVKAPGRELFNSLKRRLGKIPVIAEDLGLITNDVVRLRDDFDLPGMKILQFAFGTDSQKNSFLPENYPRNSVAYTGTHDNDTICGWFTRRPGEGSTDTAEDIERERKRALSYLNSDGDEIHWDFMGSLMRSNAGATIVPLQDILGLGAEARMNTPSTLGHNWDWRFKWNDLNMEAVNRFAALTKTTRRGVPKSSGVKLSPSKRAKLRVIAGGKRNRQRKSGRKSSTRKYR